MTRDKNIPPKWAKDAVATKRGWVDKRTGELLKCVTGLDVKPGPKPQTTHDKTKDDMAKKKEEAKKKAAAKRKVKAAAKKKAKADAKKKAAEKKDVTES